MKEDRKQLGASVRGYYDEFMYDQVIDKYYDHSDFHNFGIWKDGINSARDASRALIRELVAFAPINPARVLEVGCGKGATTQELRTHWPSAEITGIDVSETQLATCRQNCPSASFCLMDACDLDFQDSSFDLVISIEAAFHFQSRERFFEQSHRVLAPGGRLVLQDVLHHKHANQQPTSETASQYVLNPVELLPPENFISGPAEYEAMLQRAGFKEFQIIDVTEEGPRQFFSHFLAHLRDREAWAGSNSDHIRMLRIGARLLSRQLNQCLLVGASVLE